MKIKFLALSLAVFLAASGVAYAVSTPDDPGIIKDVVGASQDTTVKVFKLVRYPKRGQNDTSLAVNDVVVYDTNSDDGVTVTTSTVSADGSIAGIVVTTIQTADGNSTTAAGDNGRRNWGYIQVHGRTTAKVTAAGTGGHSAGDPWFTSTDAGAVCGIQSSVSLSTGLAKKISARGGFFFDDAVTADTTADVFVNLE